MSIPTTDAFEDTSLESLTVQLKPEQVQWLRERARRANMSLNDALQGVLDQIMEADASSSDVPSGSANGSASTETATTDGSTDDAKDDGRTQSVVESLRSTSERLEQLTRQDEDATPSVDALRERLKKAANQGDGSASADDTPEIPEALSPGKGRFQGNTSSDNNASENTASSETTPSVNGSSPDIHSAKTIMISPPDAPDTMSEDDTEEPSADDEQTPSMFDLME